MNTYRNTLLAVLILSFFSITAGASDIGSDINKEKRWADQITDFLVDGEPLWLEAQGQKFLSIYTPAEASVHKGAVVLLHGRGVHPDWPQVIQPLRTQLPGKGWATLSIQLPVLPNEAGLQKYVPLFRESPARIRKAIDYLQQQGFNNIILIGHSLGNNMATEYLAHSNDKRIQAFVGINMEAMKQPKQYLVLDNVHSLFQVKVPVLDIYGSESIEPVIKSVDRRAYVVYHSLDKKSQQIEVKGANHFFQGYENDLLSAITGWLDRASPSYQPHKLATGNIKH
jgi:pimeloyl-ACP methyl ester carboxylesterase